MTSTAILIPARYGSSRYPGKPLAKLDGVPMIQRVYNTCVESGFPTFVLTDHLLIMDLIPDQNLIVRKHDFKNGTERCAGSLDSPMLKNFTKFINVQGDMPDITVSMIQTAKRLLDMQHRVVSLFTDMDESMQNDPNCVKLVTDNKGKALWFGRGMTGYGEHHLGVYGYYKKELTTYPKLDIPKEEDIEGLEQLRWLRNGYDIQCGKVSFNGIEINSPEDVDKWHDKEKIRTESNNL